jgi:hypothetical protein
MNIVGWNFLPVCELDAMPSHQLVPDIEVVPV